MARTFTERMVGAAMLDPAVYEEVERDRNATGQAALVVTIVAVATAIGAAGHGGRGILAAVISAFLSWFMWAGVTWFVGTTFFKGTASPGELLRTLGFAMSPGVLNVLGFVPVLGGMIHFVVWIWTLIAGVIAIRQALDVDTGKAVLTAIISWGIVIVTGLLIGMLLAGAAFIGGVVR